MLSISTLIQISHQKIQEADVRGMFQTDDEIQFFFETLKGIQLELDKFTVENVVSDDQ